MAPQLILETIGVEFDLLLVDRNLDAQKSPEYLALNPQGKIPVLVHENLVLSESAAICIYLAEQHPETNLIPSLNSHLRPIFFQCLIYLTNTFQTELIVYFFPYRYLPESTSTSDFLINQENKITEMLKTIDKELENKPYLVGQHISVCGYFLFMLSVCADEFKEPPLSFKNLSQYLRSLAKRKEIAVVCDKEGLSLVDYK